jgi:anti-anti-sigma regulatory factor
VHDDFQILSFAGDLDIPRYPEFRDAFTNVAHVAPVLVDLTDAASVDSTFLSELLLFKRRRRGPVAILIGEYGSVPRIFALANIGERMGVFRQREEAVDFLFSAAPERR